MSHESVVQLIRSSGETLGMKVITVPNTYNPSMSSMISLNQTQGMGTIRQSDNHAHLRSTLNDLSDAPDNSSVYSASTNGTMRPGNLGERNRLRLANEPVFLRSLSNPDDSKSSVDGKHRSSINPNATTSSTQPPPPPPPPPLPSSLSVPARSPVLGTAATSKPPPPPPLLPVGSSSVITNTDTEAKLHSPVRKKAEDVFEEDLPLPPPPDLGNTSLSPQSAGNTCPLMQSVLNRFNHAESEGLGSFADHLREAVERRRRKIEMNFSEEDEFDEDDTSRSTCGKPPRAQSTLYSTTPHQSMGLTPSKSIRTVEVSSPNRVANRVTAISSPVEENSFRAAAEKFHAKALARTLGMTSTIPPPDNFKDTITPQPTSPKPPVAPAKPPIASSADGPKYAGSTLGRINGASKLFFAYGMNSQQNGQSLNGNNGFHGINSLRANFEKPSTGSSSIPPPPPISTRSPSSFKSGL
ncbi:unnamed protein product [Echinostoma caproni]|uniref:WH2 domain-containing protein n=1 Tax=Echinostoma caproni TaxID=27848 RepID=A0A183A7A5_9TREM|nr:unnamed protein product [Echinostoma caproni]